MYDPKVARFLQEDTYSGRPNDPLSLNLYTYCYNNPIAYDDPTGFDPYAYIPGYIQNPGENKVNNGQVQDSFWNKANKVVTSVWNHFADDPVLKEVLPKALGFNDSDQETLVGGFQKPLPPGTPVEVPEYPWVKPQPNVNPQPNIKPGTGGGNSGVYPVITAIMLALKIVSTPVEVNKGEEEFINIKQEFDKYIPYPKNKTDNDNPNEWINFDTVAAASLCSDRPEAEALRIQVGLLVKDKQMVMTDAAIQELEGNLRSANSSEKIRATLLLSRVKVIPNNPSERFMKLKITGGVDSESDKIIFGTGDKLNILTVSADSKFIRGADQQKIPFNYVDTTSKPQLNGVIKNVPGGVRVYVYDPISWNKQKQ